jgi:hypothetical protein
MPRGLGPLETAAKLAAMQFAMTKRDALRGSVAGSRGVAASTAAHALFEAGGGTLLPVQLQSAVRSTVEREATRVLAGVGLLESGSSAGVRMLEGGAVRTVAFQSARAAGRQILRSVGAAAGAGALLDGGWALVHALGRVRRGTMTQREATSYVLREASTGAAATAAGATAAVLLVALTGGVAAPAVFVVGAAASMGAKAGLDRWLGVRHSTVKGDDSSAVPAPDAASSPSPVS